MIVFVCMPVLVDFHSHFSTPSAMVCTAFPSECLDLKKDARALMHFEGLLPQYWKSGSWEVLKSYILDPDIHLGEVGMDRRFVCEISLEQQFENLITMLKYARLLGKKVTIHSVQATEPTIRAIKEAGLPAFSVLWHGFTGSKETAAQLYRLGVHVGIGPRFHGDLSAIAAANPAWVLETDYEGMDENQYNEILSSHYASVAGRLGMALDEVKEHCYGQAQAFADKPLPW